MQQGPVLTAIDSNYGTLRLMEGSIKGTPALALNVQRVSQDLENEIVALLKENELEGIPPITEGYTYLATNTSGGYEKVKNFLIQKGFQSTIGASR